MDSISQFVLGAAVGGALLGHRVGPRALLWGGVVATLPDLDVFIPLTDPVDRVTYHRSATHSLFVLTLLAPVVAWLILRFQRDQQAEWRRWLSMVWLTLVTHVLLDCFTVYGTQLFWPISNYPVGWDSIFIADPLYTVPLLGALAMALGRPKHRERLRRCAIAGLALSSAYLAFCLGASWQVTQAARASLAQQGIAYRQLLTVPTPFNTLLWRVVAMSKDSYHEGFYSVLDAALDPAATIPFTRYPDQRELLAPVSDTRAVRQLTRFTKGFYRVAQVGDQITLTDLRMGREPAYVFSFVVARQRDDAIEPVAPARAPSTLGDALLPELGELWRRIVRGPGYRMHAG